MFIKRDAFGKLLFIKRLMILFFGVIYVCKKTNLLKDNYLDDLYRRRETLKLNYALDPSKENENELKKVIPYGWSRKIESMEDSINKSLKAGFKSSGTQLTKIGQSFKNFLNNTLFLLDPQK